MQYVNPRKNPPPFSSIKNNYEQWRKEMEAWSALTKEEEKDWAKLAALACFSPDDPSGIRDKIFSLNLDHDPAVAAVPANGDNPGVPAVEQDDLAGWNRLMSFMESEYGKDSLTDMCEHIRNFMRMKKKRETPMKTYVSEFEAVYKKAKLKGLPDMPHKFLMWFLLESAGISDHEYMLVLTGVPPDSTDMYTAAKTSLLRFFNAERPKSDDQGHRIGLDSCDDVHWQGRGQARGQGGYSRGAQGGRGQQAQGGGGFNRRGGSGARGRGGQGPGPWRNPNTRQGQAQAANKPLNPKDPDGNFYLCNSCGSFRHFVKECPHRSDPYFNEEEDDYHPDNDEVLQGDPGENDQDAINTHFTGVQLFDILVNQIFHNEHTVSKILLDTGCVRTVCGRKWFQDLYTKLSPETKRRITKYPSKATFRFGGSDIRSSMGLYTVPCSISGKNILLQVDVITSDIPCLISKTTMKKAGGIINLVNDTIELFGKTIDMASAPSGHYVLPIEDFIHDEANVTLVFMATMDTDKPEFTALQVKKIHRALGHPSRKAFQQTLEASNVQIPNLDFILNKLYQSCLICLKNRPSPIKPKASLPMAQDWNQTLMIDLKVWPKYDCIIFYIIDAYTRYQQGHLIPDKKAETIVKTFVDKWIMVYGAPSNCVSDCGGEFYNQSFKSMCQNFNIRMLTSSAEAPYQNGLCEKNHAATDKIVDKMMQDDSSLTIDRAVTAATFAKNSLINVNGYSPLQLVTGKTPKLPNIFDNMLPAQECRASSKTVSDRINAILSARKVFMEVENSQRLNRALKTKILPTMINYQRGDIVFYKKEHTNSLWDGPAQVIGVSINGKTITIAHGRFTYSCPQSRLIKVPEDQVQEIRPVNSNSHLEFDSDDDDSDIAPVNVPAQVAQAPDQAPGQDPDPGQFGQELPPPPGPHPAPAAPVQAAPLTPADQVIPDPAIPDDLSDLPSTSQSRDTPPMTPPQLSQSQSRSPRTQFSFINPNINTEQSEQETVQAEHRSDQVDNQSDQVNNQRMANKKSNPKKKGAKLPYPKRNQDIFFRIKNVIAYNKVHPALVEKYGNKWAKVKILARVYANSQNSGPYFNFQDCAEESYKGGVHLDQTDWAFATERPLPVTLADSINNYLVESDPDPLDTHIVHITRDQWHTPEVQEAMAKELKNFADFQVYDLVEDRGQPFITSGWVIVRKEKEGREIVKARAVLHGNQEVNPIRSDSPTVKKTNLRIQLAIAAQNGWVMNSSDVQAAFLQATELDREVYVKPVAEAGHAGLLWLLRKPMYGLGDSGRIWYLTIILFLQEKGCVTLITDLAFAYYIKDGVLHGIVTLHVDDIQHCGTEEFETDIIKPMFEKFKFGTVQKGQFKCLGWDLVQSEDHITIDQTDYVKSKVSRVDIDIAGRDSEELLNPGEISMMRGIIGKFRWVCDQTRPDLSYDLLELAMNVNKAQVKDVKLSTKMVNHLHNHPVKVMYPKLPGDEWYITVFTDASKNVLPDGESSAMGYIILLTNGHITGDCREACPLYWTSVKMPRMVGSTLEAESIALEEGLNVAFTIKREIATIINAPEHLIKVEALCDCDDVVKAVYASTPLKTKSGRTSWEIGRIRQMLAKKEVCRVKWLEGKANPADVFTKRGAPKHLMLRTLEFGVC